jgi:hypothetical protein
VVTVTCPALVTVCTIEVGLVVERIGGNVGTASEVGDVPGVVKLDETGGLVAGLEVCGLGLDGVVVLLVGGTTTVGEDVGGVNVDEGVATSLLVGEAAELVSGGGKVIEGEASVEDGSVGRIEVKPGRSVVNGKSTLMETAQFEIVSMGAQTHMTRRTRGRSIGTRTVHRARREAYAVACSV